jgi:hypothetical protein
VRGEDKDKKRRREAGGVRGEDKDKKRKEGVR